MVCKSQITVAHSVTDKCIAILDELHRGSLVRPLADGKNHTVKIKYWPTLYAGPYDGVHNMTNRKDRGAAHTANIAKCGDCEDTNTPTKYPAPDDCYRCKLANSKPGNIAAAYRRSGDNSAIAA